MSYLYVQKCTEVAAVIRVPGRADTGVHLEIGLGADATMLVAARMPGQISKDRQEAGDLDFARRLRCFPTDAFTGLNKYVKKNIRLCLKNLQTVERKQKAKLRRQKQEKTWQQKHAAARRVSGRATVALAMVVEAIRRKRLG